MIYDILEIFRKEYEKDEKGDNLVLGSYELKEGLYVKINKNYKIEYFMVKKKNRELFFTDIDENLNYSAYKWFKERDYYSCYLNSNKAFYDKKIHSINYFSLFVKLDSFISAEPKKILKCEVIDKHYYNLCNYKKFQKKQEIEILQDFQKYLTNRERRKDIIKKYKFLRENLDCIVTIAKENKIKNYVKVFFDESVEKYREESKIYYSIKIFNDINYCKTIEGKNFGLSNSNMGLNTKKPYLEHKTKFNTVPFLIEKNDALILKIFFDWLKLQSYKDKENKPKDRYLDDNFFMQKHSSNDEAEITDFDYVPTRKNELEKPILIKNYLWLKENKTLIQDDEIGKLSRLEAIVDDIFYNHQLINNYYGEVWKKLDNSFANFIYITRDAMIAYFRKYDEKGFFDVIKKYGSKLIIEHMKKDRLLKAGKALNLKLSLLEYKGEKIMNIKQMQEKIIEKLMTSNYDNLNVEEFFYLCGQIARYLISQSEAFEKKGDMLDPFLKAKNVEKLKEVIKIIYQKYNHKILLELMKTNKEGIVYKIYLKKFGNAISLVMAYNDDFNVKDNYDSLLIGALSENIFYMKNEEIKGE